MMILRPIQQDDIRTADHGRRVGPWFYILPLNEELLQNKTYAPQAIREATERLETRAIYSYWKTGNR